MTAAAVYSNLIITDFIPEQSRHQDTWKK